MEKPMPIHRNYARLNAADRAVIDAAFRAATDVFHHSRRRFSNSDKAERVVEALATYMIESGGAARENTADGPYGNYTAPDGEEHESYNA
jgi:hypothetical protein